MKPSRPLPVFAVAAVAPAPSSKMTKVLTEKGDDKPSLASLPKELLQHVLYFLDARNDLTSLTLANKLLRVLVERVCHKRLMEIVDSIDVAGFEGRLLGTVGRTRIWDHAGIGGVSWRSLLCEGVYCTPLQEAPVAWENTMTDFSSNGHGEEGLVLSPSGKKIAAFHSGAILLLEMPSLNCLCELTNWGTRELLWLDETNLLARTDDNIVHWQCSSSGQVVGNPHCYEDGSWFLGWAKQDETKIIFMHRGTDLHLFRVSSIDIQSGRMSVLFAVDITKQNSKRPFFNGYIASMFVCKQKWLVIVLGGYVTYVYNLDTYQQVQFMKHPLGIHMTQALSSLETFFLESWVEHFHHKTVSGYQLGEDGTLSPLGTVFPIPDFCDSVVASSDSHLVYTDHEGWNNINLHCAKTGRKLFSHDYGGYCAVAISPLGDQLVTMQTGEDSVVTRENNVECISPSVVKAFCLSEHN